MKTQGGEVGLEKTYKAQKKKHLMPLNRKIKNLANFTNLQTKKLCIAFETSPY